MPLPDERPRQSVANLIGRFEQQGKRQILPAVPVVPRSSSVSSQIVGDAAKEEIKEKREWPPKPVASADIKPVAPTLSSSPSPGMSKSPLVSPQPIPDPPPPVDAPTTPTPASPEPAKSPPSKGKAVATGKVTPSTGVRRAAASPAKPRTSAARSSASPPPKTSLQASISQPLRPHHTGQSTTSNHSTIRHARPIPRTAPSTPSRPKSSNTQQQAVTRPKTPSSGLFAPTAASLARSRNAPLPPPPPVRKVTLSSDAAERLSKPTAASLSKARTPVSTTLSPPRVTKSASAGPHVLTPRGPSKLKVARTSAKPREAIAKEGIKSEPASISSEPSHASDQPVADHTENGHEAGVTTFSDVGSLEYTHGHSEVASDTVVHDPVADEDVHSDHGVHPEQQAIDHPAEEGYSHEPVEQNLPEEEAVHEPEQVRLEAHDDTIPESAELHASEVIENEGSLKVELTTPGNEIEDIVNLLEGAPLLKPRPQSIVTIPDEGEILGEY